MKLFAILFFFVCVSLPCFSQNRSELAAWRNTPAEDSVIVYRYKKNKRNYTVLKIHKKGTYILHELYHFYGKARLGSRDWITDDKGTWQLWGDTLLITSVLSRQSEKLIAKRKKLSSTLNQKTYKVRRRAPKYR